MATTQLSRTVAQRSESAFSPRLFLTVLALGGLGIVSYVPFASAIGLPSTVTGLQVALLLAGALIGTRYAASLGLHLPLIEDVLTGSFQAGRAVKRLAPMIGVGILLGLTALAFNYFITWRLHFIATGAEYYTPSGLPLYMELLGPPLYGGITEEIVFRYGLMTAIAVVLAKLAQSSERINLSSAAVMWGAIVASSIPFALEHVVFYPVLTPGIVASVLVSLGLTGVLLGWIFWKRGLESAMMVHITMNVTSIIALSLLF